ncbi:MAG: hypothetical protein C0434_03400 [Xanthomonadaceae bacterium]|nr:hypothetical protein [Xanthomonadaceae bacterium]
MAAAAVGRPDRRCRSGRRGLAAQFDRDRATTIRSGENAGKRIVYPNVMRSFCKLADGSNQPLDLDAALSDDERGEQLALLVQARGGPVWTVVATD